MSGLANPLGRMMQPSEVSNHHLFCKLLGISPDAVCLQQYTQGWLGAQGWQTYQDVGSGSLGCLPFGFISLLPRAISDVLSDAWGQ